MSTANTRTLESALRYARLGWPVLPLEPNAKNPLARLVPNGAKDATTDRFQIARWWAECPAANLGISCERLLVVDVDPRNNGFGELVQTVSRFGGIPSCPTVTTGSEGAHYFFKLPSVELKGKLCPGVDLIHGRNRYVVAAPSVHPSGGVYRWTSLPGLRVAAAPDWLTELARRPPPKPLPARTCGADTLERAMRYASKAEPAVSGAGGHNLTFRVCAAIVSKFDLSESDALRALADWNARCEPPWSEHQLRKKLRDAAAKLR